MEPFSKHGTSYNPLYTGILPCKFWNRHFIRLIFDSTHCRVWSIHTFSYCPRPKFWSLLRVTLAILIAWFILRYKQWVRTGIVKKPFRKWPHLRVQLVLYKDHNGKEEPVHGGHSSWLQIVLFGTWSVAYLISNVVKVLSETNADKIQVGKILDILACCVLFIVFLSLYNGVFLVKNTRLFNYGIAVMISADMCEWISITTSPFWEHKDNNTTILTISKNSSIPMSYHTDSNFELVLESVQTFLQPFFVEFLSISAACLLELWETIRTNVWYHVNYKPEFTADEFQSIGSKNNSEEHNEFSRIHKINGHHYQAINRNLNLLKTSRISLYKPYKMCSKFSTSIVVVISMFAAVVYATHCFITFMPIIPVQKDNIVIQIIYKGNITIGFGPLIMFQLLALYKIYKSNICMQKSQHFTSTNHLLLFTSAAMFVYDILRIIALIGSLAYRGNIDTFRTILQIIF